MEKYCTKCGKKFVATGREVICPACKQAAAEEAKKAAVMRAKRASWTGESVPVRISGRASTVIRLYGKANNMPFAAALDDLLQSTGFFANLGVDWPTIQPYKSRRLKKSTDAEQDGIQAVQDAPQDVQAAKTTSKSSSKTASKAAKKAVKTAKTAKTAK